MHEIEKQKLIECVSYRKSIVAFTALSDKNFLSNIHMIYESGYVNMNCYWEVMKIFYTKIETLTIAHL